MVLYNSLPKYKCSKCTSTEVHYFNSEFSTDLLGNCKSIEYWVQCNNCSNKLLLSTTTTTSAQSSYSTWTAIKQISEIIQF